MNRRFRDDVCVETVAEVDGIDVVAISRPVSLCTCIEAKFDDEVISSRWRRTGSPPNQMGPRATDHSRSLYIIVKKT